MEVLDSYTSHSITSDVVKLVAIEVHGCCATLKGLYTCRRIYEFTFTYARTRIICESLWYVDEQNTYKNINEHIRVFLYECVEKFSGVLELSEWMWHERKTSKILKKSASEKIGRDICSSISCAPARFFGGASSVKGPWLDNILPMHLFQTEI